MANLFQKLSDYLLPYPERQEDFKAEKILESEPQIEVQAQPEPQTQSVAPLKSQASATNQDLMQLLDLGEHGKAWQLAKKYNYFNIHPVLSLTFAQAGDYRSALEVMEELVAGPLAGVMSQATNDKASEFFYLPRTIYILDYATRQYQHPAFNSDLSAAVIQKWRARPSFEIFLDRLHTQMAAIAADQRRNYLQSQLEKLLIVNLEKLQEIYDLESQPLSIDVQMFQTTSFADDFFAEKRPQIIQTLNAAKENSVSSADWAIFNQARQNIQNYLTAGEPKNYIQTQGKMDLMALSGKLSPEAIHSLARRLEISDFYPYISYLWHQAGDHENALAAAQEFVRRSDLFSTSHSFQDEVFKENFLGYMAELLRKSPDGCLHSLSTVCGEQLAGQYQSKLHQLMGAPGNLDGYLENTLMPLVTTQKIIFKHN